MSAIKGVIQDGQVVLPGPIGLPNGTEVEVVPVDPVENDDGPMSPEEIERVLALMDQMQPLEMTDAELAAWEAARQEQKEWEKAHFFEHAEKLRKMWP